MAIPRFHCPQEIPSAGIFRLPAQVAHHAFRVLRLGKGEEIVLFDGMGWEFRCRVLDSASVEIFEKIAMDRESKLSITLVQALAASEKMDWVVQKAVELGAKSIQIVETRRSTVRLSGERAKKREDHWANVAISACEQCGRNRIPEILPIVQLEVCLPTLGQGKKLLLSPMGKPLRDFSQPGGEIYFLIGPEGGLSPEEEAIALSCGFEAMKLGPRILRTETAGLAAISALHALWGDFF